MSTTIKHLLFTIALLLFSLKGIGQIVIINPDTIEINIKGTIGPLIKSKENYYCCFFNNYHGYTNNQFYIINSKSQKVKEVKVPNEIQNNHLDLFINNDEIFSTEYWNDITFYLDKNISKWISTKKHLNIIYEDKDFIVTSHDYGEWGGNTWFIDKKTKEQYISSIINPIVNKLDSVYYLTTSREIFKIANPRELKRCNKKNSYRRTMKKSFFSNRCPVLK